MSRVTRSKKIIIAEDDTQIATQISLPDTPGGQRRALGEIYNTEQAPEIMTIEDVEMASQLKGLKAAYKTALGVKKKSKGKKGKKGKQEQQEQLVEDNGESRKVLDDRQTAVVSPATSEARQILNSDPGHDSSPKETAISPPSPAVRATRQRLADVPSAEDDTQFKSLRVSLAEVQSASLDRDGDINTTTPMKSPIITLDDVEKSCHAQDSKFYAADKEEDSFVEQIILRTPAKPASRIEDSVEELDKMAEIEEALNEVTMAEHMVAEKSTNASVTRERSPRTFKPAAVSENGVAKKNAPGFSSLRVKSKDAPKGVPSREKAADVVKRMKPSPALRPASAFFISETSDSKESVSKKPAKRPASLLPPKQHVKTVRPTTISTFELPGEAIALRLKEQREARKAQREAAINDSLAVPAGSVRIKSAKVPTKSTFELPGEAVSRRKRDAHEARLKAQEEEEKKRREFKAKPLRKSILPDVLPRDTIASRARKSQIGMADQETIASGHPYSSLSVVKRGSVVGAHRPSILATNLANTSAPRAGINGSQTSLSRKPSTTCGPSMSGLAKQRSVSTADSQNQRQRAREIYNRDMRALEDIEREKREREVAAKKSREEAAERGRQASREWAEKQRAKKAAEGDKGLSAGFGPGGQIGLRA